MGIEIVWMESPGQTVNTGPHTRRNTEERRQSDAGTRREIEVPGRGHHMDREHAEETEYTLLVYPLEAGTVTPEALNSTLNPPSPLTPHPPAHSSPISNFCRHIGHNPLELSV